MKINRNVLIVILLLFPILKPVEDAIAVLVGVNFAHIYIRILSIWNYANIFIVGCWFFVKLREGKLRITKYTKIVTLLCLVFIMATLREFSFSVLYVFRLTGNLLLILILANIYSGRRFYYFLKGCYIYLTFLSVLNAISIYVFSPGMYRTDYYLLGLDNMGFIIALHSFFAGIICNIVEKGKIGVKMLFLYTMIFSAYVYCKSGTAIAMCVVTIIFLVFYKSRLMKFVTYKKTILIVFAIFLSITLMQNLGLWKMVSNLLGKGSTFNGRTIIWAAMFNVIPKHLIMGFGVMPEVTQYYIGLYPSGGWLSEIGHMHNIIFEFLFRGGIIGVILFVLLWISCIEKMEANKTKLLYRVLCVQFLFSMVVCMFEFRLDTYTFWILPICLYEIDSLNQKNYRMKKWII